MNPTPTQQILNTLYRQLSNISIELITQDLIPEDAADHLKELLVNLFLTFTSESDDMETDTTLHRVFSFATVASQILRKGGYSELSARLVEIRKLIMRRPDLMPYTKASVMVCFRTVVTHDDPINVSVEELTRRLFEVPEA